MAEKEYAELLLQCVYTFEMMKRIVIARGCMPEDMLENATISFMEDIEQERTQIERRLTSYRQIIQRFILDCDKSNDLISLTQIAKKYNAESPGYMIQSWMRSRNTIDFLRQWETSYNVDFDDAACDELLQCAKGSSFTLTPKQWVSKTKAIGMFVKQGKGGGVTAHPDIAHDFQIWLDPAVRLALVRYVRENKAHNAKFLEKD